MTSKKIFMAGLLLCLGATSIWADAASDKDKALENLMVAIRIEDLSKSFYDQSEQLMRAGIYSAVDETQLTDQQKALMDKYLKKASALISSEMSYKNMKSDYKKIYSDNFTIEQIQAITNFYQSDAGQSFVSKQETILQQSIALAQQKMMVLEPKLKKLTEEFLEKAKTEEPTKSKKQ